MRNLIGIGISLAIASACCQPACFASEPTEAPSTPAECIVTCVNPHTTCKEAEKVLEVLQTLVKALNSRDWKTYAEHIDDHCSTFDEDTHTLISGKEKVVNDMKHKAEKYAREGAPFLSVTIDQPHVSKISGDTAVVNFFAIRQFGGKSPYKEEANAIEVFVKRGDTWKKCHFRAVWKRV